MLNVRSQINVSWSKLYCTYKTLSCRWLSVSWASWLDQQLQRGGKQFFASVSLTESVVYLSALQVNFTTRSVRALQAFNTFIPGCFIFHCTPLLFDRPHSRPAKSGKWRKCLSQKFLDCTEICQHKHNKS